MMFHYYRDYPMQPDFVAQHGGFVGGWLLPLLFWGLLILGFVLLFKYLLTSHKEKDKESATAISSSSYSGERTPLDIVKERYAKGEINREEFEQKKKDLA